MKAFHEVRNYPTDLMVWHKDYENISFIAHWHREIELLYIKSGSIKMQVSSHSFTAHKGDLIICDTGDIHYSNAYEKDVSPLSYGYLPRIYFFMQEVISTGVEPVQTQE